MPRKTVYSAAVEHLQILDEDGVLDAELAAGTLTDAEVKALYTKMIICRAFDETAFKLQRSGRMGTFPQNKGQEATSLGAARALRKGHDHLVPFYRDNPAMFLHGLPMHYALLHWMGDERGNAVPRELAMNPINVAIGTQTLHAAGIAWAFKMRGEDRVVLTTFGDGATSTGDFHEAMNFASVMKLPVVFVCVNNGWAISTPCSKQTGCQTFAQKALAYDMPTVQVDGNDLFAVYKATRDFVEEARAGGGPRFIEAVTYRLGDHTTADDARRYRPADELDVMLKRDPLVRTRKYLESKGLWNDEEEGHAQARAQAIVKDVVKVALEIEKPPAADLFNHTFAELPPDLARQRDTLRTESIGQSPDALGLQPPKEPEIKPAAHRNGNGAAKRRGFTAETQRAQRR